MAPAHTYVSDLSPSLLPLPPLQPWRHLLVGPRASRLLSLQHLHCLVPQPGTLVSQVTMLLLPSFPPPSTLRCHFLNEAYLDQYINCDPCSQILSFPSPAPSLPNTQYNILIHYGYHIFCLSVPECKLQKAGICFSVLFIYVCVKCPINICSMSRWI